MNENNSIEAIDKSNLTEQTEFRLSEIIEIEIIFNKTLIEKSLIVKN